MRIKPGILHTAPDAGGSKPLRCPATSIRVDTPFLLATAPLSLKQKIMKAHRVTVADDDPNYLVLLYRTIAKLYPGSSIAAFSNPEDALAHIRTTGTDILITDHGMGRMSGSEMRRILREQKVEIPIIMVSANPNVAGEAEKAGADVFVEKSLDMSAIRERIQQLLQD